jgi:hypothetical protein
MPNTADGHWKMAEWCLSHGLDAERQYHLREILKFDPEHEQARSKLGFQKRDGRWLTMDDIMSAQGFIRHNGQWRLQQDLDLHAARDRAKQDEIHWRKEVKRLHNKMNSSSGSDIAFDEFKAIRHPAAAPAIADLLSDTRETRDMRRLYVEMLGRMNSAAAISALCHTALQDSDSSIRDRCLDMLVDNGERQAIQFFLSKLDEKKNSNGTINRAGVALGRFKDPDTTPALIEALVTSHKRQVGGGGGLSVGSGGLSVGGGPKQVIETFNNDGVLSGLTATNPGVNCGFNKEEWRRWYADSNAPKSVQLRRDP